ncbi:MAG: hypothetical protein E6497_13995 [Escherichia coli]|nr:hypothetical protein [Escherichia coli]
MDITSILHALCAVAVQVLAGLFTGNWAYGAIAGCSLMDFAVPVVACLLIWMLIR